MEIVSLDASNVAAFVAYCRQHAVEHDDSFVADTALLPSDDYPGSMLLHNGDVVGAVCLIRTTAFREARKGRFLIFHTTQPGSEPYAMLLQSILPATHDLDMIYGFIPQTRQATGRIWEQFGLFIERRSYILRYDDPNTPEPSLPGGFVCQPVQPADDKAIASFCDLINLNFADLAGHVDSSPDDIKELLPDPIYLSDGIMLLYDENRPVGTLALSIESSTPDTAFIEMFSLLPEYRGRGLGRALLREGVRIARARGYATIDLSVNAENDAAVRLYISERFRQTQVMLCYRLNMR
ncbi:MAG: GNAT family N-acetyltransferase [Anaerolineae bacterium]